MQGYIFCNIYTPVGGNRKDMGGKRKKHDAMGKNAAGEEIRKNGI